MLNNGFDAMGDAIGRFGRGVYQAIGMLEDEGDSLTFKTVVDSDKQHQYVIIFTKIGGRIRLNYRYEKLPRTHSTGTEVILHKKKGISEKDRLKLDKYVLKKMGLSRRGPIYNSEDEESRINNLKDFRHGVDAEGDPIKVKYRLGEKGVRYWFDRENNLHIEDSGTGMLPLKDKGGDKEASVILESLPVPYASTNRTGSELKTALARQDWTADGEALFYRGKGDAKKAKITIEVGGTEAETIELEGMHLPDELVIDLPTAAEQLESRNQIRLEEVTVQAFKDIIDEYTERFKGNPQEYAPVINALSLLVSRLQNSERAKSDRRADNLERYLREQMGKAAQEIDAAKYALVPNLKTDYLSGRGFEGKAYVYLNEELWQFDPGTIGGAQVATVGKAVWKVAGMKKPYARIGKHIILIRQDEYDHFMDRSRRFENKGSIVLNLLFSMWSGYGRRSPAEVEFKATDDAAVSEEQVNGLMEEAGIPEALQLPIIPFVRNALESGHARGKVLSAARRLSEVQRLMDSSALQADDLFKITVMEDAGARSLWMVDGRVMAIVETARGQALYEIDPKEGVKLLVSGYEMVNAPVSAGGRIFITAKREGRATLWELMPDTTLRVIIDGESSIFSPQEHEGRIYFTSGKSKLISLYVLDSKNMPELLLTDHDAVEYPSKIGVHSYIESGKRGEHLTLHILDNDGRPRELVSGMKKIYPIEQFGNYEYFATEGEEGEILWAVGRDGNAKKVLSGKSYGLFELAGHVYIVAAPEGKKGIYEIDQRIIN
jgi:hypothetical protein